VNVATLWTPTRKWEPDPWVEPDDGFSTGFTFDRDEPAVRQAASWTCACASMAWVMNALGEDAPDGGKWDEWAAVQVLRDLCGYGAVSPDYGLAYASGVDLETVYAHYGYSVERVVGASWQDVAYLCAQGIGQLGGARWYHWTGVRGYSGSSFNLANPAYSWKGVGDELDANEWNAWGAWNALMIVGTL
jgi:hypothetical protein